MMTKKEKSEYLKKYSGSLPLILLSSYSKPFPNYRTLGETTHCSKYQKFWVAGWGSCCEKCVFQMSLKSPAHPSTSPSMLLPTHSDVRFFHLCSRTGWFPRYELNLSEWRWGICFESTPGSWTDILKQMHIFRTPDDFIGLGCEHMHIFLLEILTCCL